MIRSWVVTVLALSALGVGCQSTANRDLLERELRRQEDCIYYLQGQVCEAREQLEATQLENESLRSNSGRDEAEAAPVRRGLGNGRKSIERSPTRPNIQNPAPEQAPPFIGPPQISPPDVRMPEGSFPSSSPSDAPPASKPSGSSASTPPGLMPSNPAFPTPPEIELPTPSVEEEVPSPTVNEAALPHDSIDVAEIILNPVLTGGFDADTRPGDEGVTVLLEPRGPAGELLGGGGKVSIVVMDPSQTGEAARVARWNFTADEAARHYLPDAGLRFDLRWPQRAPKQDNLKLYVRLVRADGKKFDAEQDLHVTLAATALADETRWKKSAAPLAVPTPIPTVPLAPSGIATESPTVGSAIGLQPPLERTARPARTPWTPYR